MMFSLPRSALLFLLLLLFPLSHYVLLFHITAKQFEASPPDRPTDRPRGSPFFPPRRWILLGDSWPTWRGQYILRSYKLSKHGWLAGSAGCIHPTASLAALTPSM